MTISYPHPRVSGTPVSATRAAGGACMASPAYPEAPPAPVSRTSNHERIVPVASCAAGAAVPNGGPAPITPGLMPRQRELLLFIADYIAAHGGVSPSFDEMKTALRLQSKSGIHRLIDGLTERGYITRTANRARSIELVGSRDLHATACEMLLHLELVHKSIKDGAFKERLAARLPQWRKAVTP